MINKARCKAHPARKSVQVGKDASREGNKVVEGDGKTGMEYKQVKAKPLGAGKVIDWNE